MTPKPADANIAAVLTGPCLSPPAAACVWWAPVPGTEDAAWKDRRRSATCSGGTGRRLA